MKGPLLVLLLWCVTAPAQVWNEVTITPLIADSFEGIDTYNNVYYIQDMVLYKTGVQGRYEFRDYQLGPISSVDIINPLNIVVFYEQVNTVILLDNRLNEIERINFNSLPEFINISAAKNAGNNRLWIFNVDSQQLELYNYRNGSRTAISQPIPGNFKGLVSDFNYSYVLTSNGLQSYNVYGSFLNEIALDGCRNISLFNDRIFAVTESENLLIKKGFSEAEVQMEGVNLPLPENSIKDLQLTQDFLYIYDGNNIRGFSLTNPKK